MSDLSRLLDDVYRSGPSTPAPPAWSSDSALDEVFSDWVPGEPEGATPAEQAFVDFEPPGTDDTLQQLDALVQQAAALEPDITDEDEDDVGQPEVVSPAVNRDAAICWTPERATELTEPVRSAPAITPWSRHDDDILPHRGLSGRRRFSLRRH